MRDQANQFFWIDKVTDENLQINRFCSCPDLEETATTQGDTNITDYIIIPSDKSGSRKMELLVADPEEGFHLLYTDE